jgi:trans-2-enoyl-CoA reductase
MLLNRRSVLAGALLPLAPAANSDDDELLLLGAQLEVLQRRQVARRRAGLAGDGWQRWNEAVVASVALAERIGRTPAHDVVGFSIKLRAICCEWEHDLEDHQLRRLRELAGEMQRAG